MIAMAFALCGHISDSHAGCVAVKKGDLTLVGDCEVGFNENPNLPMQFAGLPGDNDQSPASAGISGGVAPSHNGIRRYVCTPSGFSRTASCSLRSAN